MGMGASSFGSPYGSSMYGNTMMGGMNNPMNPQMQN